MRLTKVTYAQAEGCFFEAMRVNVGKIAENVIELPDEEKIALFNDYQLQQQQKQSKKSWSKEKESNSLIDISRTKLNYELVPHHSCLNPDNAFKKPYRSSKKQKNIVAEKDNNRTVRGQSIANYHKSVTGRSARMNGDEAQLSKAEGCLITLPRDYLQKDLGLTEDEYMAINQYLSSYEEKASYPELNNDLQSAIKKFEKLKEFSEDEYNQIRNFFEAAFKSFLKVTNTRPEDVLYSVVHLDETFPHLHIMVLPGMTSKETGRFTFSMTKFDKVNFPLYEFHSKMIQAMNDDFGIDASGLLNGASKKKKFLPGDLSRQEREQSVIISNMHTAISNKSNSLEQEINTKQEKLAELSKSNQILIETITENNAIVEQSNADTERKRAELKSLTERVNKLRGEVISEEEQKQIVLNNRSLFKKIKKDETINVKMTYEQAQGFKAGVFNAEQLAQLKKEQEEKEKLLNKKEQEQAEHQKQIEQERVSLNSQLQDFENYKQQIEIKNEKEKKQLDKERQAFKKEKDNFNKLVSEKANQLINQYIKPLFQEISFLKIIKDWKLKHNNKPLDEALKEEHDRRLSRLIPNIEDFDTEKLHATITNTTKGYNHDYDIEDYDIEL